MVVRMWSNWNSHLLLVGKQNGTATLEDTLAVSYKTKHTLNIRSSSHAPWYLPKGVENLSPHKNLHTDVYSSFIPNCQTWKQPRCLSLGEWIKCGACRQWNIIQPRKK